MEIDFRICEHGACSGTSGSTCVTNYILEHMVDKNNYDSNVSDVDIMNESSLFSSVTVLPTVPVLDSVCWNGLLPVTASLHRTVYPLLEQLYPFLYLYAFLISGDTTILNIYIFSNRRHRADSILSFVTTKIYRRNIHLT